MSAKELGIGIKNIDVIQKYWDERPCNIRHSSKDIGTKEYFDEVEHKKYFVEPHIPPFADFHKWKGKKVFEVGCGIGTDAVNFARSGAQYFAIDVSQESIDLAKIRFNVFKLNGNFFHGNAEIITSITSENNFDLVYSFGVIHHTTNPRAVIEEAYKLLKAGGELRIMLYNKNSWKSFMIECGMDQPEAQSGCPVALAYDESDIHELIGDLFDIDSITNEHIFPYVIENYRKNEYTLEPWFREMPEKMFKHLEKKLGWHTLIKATKKLA